MNIQTNPTRKNVNLSTIDQISFEFREDFILTGYRLPDSSFKNCFKSIFYLHNETINFWTHFFPFLFISFQLLQIVDTHNVKNDYFVWPLFIYLITICFYLLMSSVAHMMNCYSSTARHICFILDYLTISIYGVGCSMVYKSYTIKNINLQIDTKNLFDKYIWLTLGFTLISNIVSCSTRFILTRSKRGILRAGSFILQYMFVNLPLLYRFLVLYFPKLIVYFNYFFSFLSSSSLLTLEHSSNNTETNGFNFRNESDVFYLAQFIAALLSAFLYVTHFPESLFPGKFDLIGSSHQIFHLTAFSTTWFQYKAIESDIKQLNQHISLYSIDSKFGIELNYTFIMSSCIFFNGLILLYYYFKASYFNPWTMDNGFEIENELNRCSCFKLADFDILKSFKPHLKSERSEKKLS